jgi:hypothetical protein
MPTNKDFTEPKARQAQVRKNLRVGNLSEEAVEALKKAEMDERHESLNALIQN